jgi:hypothetical protein
MRAEAIAKNLFENPMNGFMRSNRMRSWPSLEEEEEGEEAVGRRSFWR